MKSPLLFSVHTFTGIIVWCASLLSWEALTLCHLVNAFRDRSHHDHKYPNHNTAKKVLKCELYCLRRKERCCWCRWKCRSASNHRQHTVDRASPIKSAISAKGNVYSLSHYFLVKLAAIRTFRGRSGRLYGYDKPKLHASLLFLKMKVSSFCYQLWQANREESALSAHPHPFQGKTVFFFF